VSHSQFVCQRPAGLITPLLVHDAERVSCLLSNDHSQLLASAQHDPSPSRQFLSTFFVHFQTATQDVHTSLKVSIDPSHAPSLQLNLFHLIASHVAPKISFRTLPTIPTFYVSCPRHANRGLS
jgi:hypothetical protein